jgi:hypothetical protein
LELGEDGDESNALKDFKLWGLKYDRLPSPWPKIIPTIAWVRGYSSAAIQSIGSRAY